MAKLPLLTNGITLNGPATQSSNGNLSDVEAGIFIDNEGNLVFKDDYVTNYLHKDGVKLKELYSRVKGIYFKDNQLFFKDETVSREYSLQEIVNSLSNIRRNLTSGSLWWTGSKITDHVNCANIPLENGGRDNALWSIDRFLVDDLGISFCSDTSSIDVTDKFTDIDTGEWKWWDVQNLDIVIPPVTDRNKVSFIIAKLSYFQRNGTAPIVFRLYDATANRELTRVAVVQNNCFYSGTPIPLVYFGPITPSVNLTSQTVGCNENTGCGCVTTECVDNTCIVPNPSYIQKTYNAESHLIKVQFHVSTYHSNHWDRIFGYNEDLTPSAQSSISGVIFDTSQGEFIRKQGSVNLINTKKVKIQFDTKLPNRNYTVSLSANKNIQVWYSEKTENGFVINCETEMTGIVDWTLININ